MPAQDTVSFGTFHEGGIECRLTGPDAWKPFRGVAELRSSSGELLYQMAGQDTMGFPNLAPGSYLMRILPQGEEVWRPQWFDRASTRGTARPIVLSADAILVPVTCTLERGGSIRGRVTLPDGGAPGRLGLKIWSPEFGLDERWKTNPDGSFDARGLPEGQLKLAAVVRESGPERVIWFPGTADRDSASVITMRGAEEVRGIEFRLLQ